MLYVVVSECSSFYQIRTNGISEKTSTEIIEHFLWCVEQIRKEWKHSEIRTSIKFMCTQRTTKQDTDLSFSKMHPSCLKWNHYFVAKDNI